MTLGQSHLGCTLDVAFALVIAEPHITENDVVKTPSDTLSGEETQGEPNSPNG